MLNDSYCITALSEILHLYPYSPFYWRHDINICVTNDHGYVPLVVITIRSFPHSCLIMLYCNKSNTTDGISGSRTAYPSREPQFTPFFRDRSGVRVVKLYVVTFLVPCCNVRCDYREKITPICFVGGS